MDDLIRRSDAIRVVSGIDSGFVKYIEKLPSVQADRKTGFWIPQDFNKPSGFITTAVYYYPKCSICGWTSNYTNFCPNCGAQMKGEEDEQKK